MIFAKTMGIQEDPNLRLKVQNLKVLIYPLLHMADFQSPSYRYYHKNLEGYALVGEFFFCYLLQNVCYYNLEI